VAYKFVATSQQKDGAVKLWSAGRLPTPPPSSTPLLISRVKMYRVWSPKMCQRFAARMYRADDARPTAQVEHNVARLDFSHLQQRRRARIEPLPRPDARLDNDDELVAVGLDGELAEGVVVSHATPAQPAPRSVSMFPPLRLATARDQTGIRSTLG